MVGGKYVLNDQEVKTIINKRYNPEGEVINEEISHEKTYDISQTAGNLPELPPKKEPTQQYLKSPDESSMVDYTVAEYTIIGGKKKKKKKKKKRPASRGNVSAVGNNEDLKPIKEEPTAQEAMQTEQLE